MFDYKLYKDIAKHFEASIENNSSLQLCTSDIKLLPLLFYMYEYLTGKGYKINTFFIRKNRSKVYNGSKIEGHINGDNIICLENITYGISNILFLKESLRVKGREIFGIYSPFYNKSIDLEYLHLSFAYYKGKYLKIGLNTEEITDDIDYILHSGISDKWNLKKRNIPLVYEKGLISYGDDGELISYSIEEGKVNWRLRLGKCHCSMFLSLLIIEGILYVGTGEGDFVMIDLESGKRLQTLPISDFLLSRIDYSDRKKQFTLIGGYASKYNKYIGVKINQASFEETKIKLLETNILGNISFFEDEDLILFQDEDLYLNFISYTDFQYIKKVYVGSSISGDITYDKQEKKLYFSTLNGFVYRLSIEEEGEERLKVSNYWLTHSPCVTESEVYVGCADKKIYVLDKKHFLIKGSISTSGRVFSKIIFIKHTYIIFGSNDCNLYIYNIKRGKIKKVQLAERILNGIIYEDQYNSLFIQDFMNNIYRIGMLGL